MKVNEQRYDTIRDYLLGGLTEDAKEQFEMRLMTEEEDFQELLIQEKELVDDYVRDRLSEPERLRFESHFLCTPERRRKLRFAATLRDYLRDHWKTASGRTKEKAAHRGFRSLWDWFFKFIPHPTPAWGALTAALVLAVTTGVWSTLGYLRLQDQLVRVSAERGVLLEERGSMQQQLAVERARAEEIARTVLAQREEPSPPAPSGGVAPIPFSLSPGLFRGAGEMVRIRIPSHASFVDLQLDIGLDEYPQYRATLQEAEGEEVWMQAKLDARTVSDGAIVVLTLPAQLLATGDYSVSIDGVAEDDTTERVGRYDFRVVRE